MADNKRPLTEILKELERGQFVDDVTEAHEEVLDKVRHTGKQGSLTITLTYKPVNDEQVTVQADINQKPPKLPRDQSLFYMDGALNLTRNDPRQQELPMRSVPGGATEDVRTVSGD